jgi:transposase
MRCCPGVTDPEELAELAKARLRLKIPQLREALANRFKVDHHGILVAQLLAHIDRECPTFCV